MTRDYLNTLMEASEKRQERISQESQHNEEIKLQQQQLQIQQQQQNTTQLAVIGGLSLASILIITIVLYLIIKTVRRPRIKK